MSIFDLFEKPKTVQEKVKEMTRNLDKEIRNIERQIQKMNFEEKKLGIEAKKFAKKDTSCLKMVVKQIVNVRNMSKRLFRTKVQISSVSMQLNLHVSQIGVVKSLQKSGEIMKMMNNLCKVQTISGVMQNLSREMIKMNLIEESINDGMDDMFDDIDDNDIDLEVSKVMDEIMMSVKNNTVLPANNLPIINKQETNDDVILEDRLNQLRN